MVSVPGGSGVDRSGPVPRMSPSSPSPGLAASWPVPGAVSGPPGEGPSGLEIVPGSELGGARPDWLGICSPVCCTCGPKAVGGGAVATTSGFLVQADESSSAPSTGTRSKRNPGARRARPFDVPPQSRLLIIAPLLREPVTPGSPMSRLALPDAYLAPLQWFLFTLIAGMGSRKLPPAAAIPSKVLVPEHDDTGDSPEAAEVVDEAAPGGLDLSLSGAAAKLVGDLADHPQAGRADRVAA